MSFPPLQKMASNNLYKVVTRKRVAGANPGNFFTGAQFKVPHLTNLPRQFSLAMFPMIFFPMSVPL